MQLKHLYSLLPWCLPLCLPAAVSTPAAAQDNVKALQLAIATNEPPGKAQSARHLDSVAAIIGRRFQQLGIADPTITADHERGTVNITVAWPYNYKRLANYVTAPGSMELVPCYGNTSFFPWLLAANDTLAATMPPAYLAAPNDKEAEMRNKYPLFSVLMPVLNSGSELFEGGLTGRVKIGDTSRLAKLLLAKAVRSALPPDASMIYYHYRDTDTLLSLCTLRLPAIKEEIITERNLRHVRAVNDEKYAHQQVVVIELNKAGTAKWKRMTSNNIGKYIAIVYNNQVYSCPRVMDTISDGGAMMQDHFTAEEVTDIANILNSGQLPVPVHMVATQQGELEKK